MISRALSIRVIFLSLVGGVVGGVLVTSIAPAVPTMPVVWIVAGLVYVVAVMNDEQMVKCDACSKRVKMGASTCHHCGYTRV